MSAVWLSGGYDALPAGRSSADGPSHRATTPSTPARTTEPQPPRPTAPFPVGFATRTFVDTSRIVYPPHTANGQPEPRTLATDIWYPSSAGSPGATTPGAPAAEGPFPLVVFGPGYDETPAPYANLLASWATAGYVVAAVTFPLTNPSTPGGLDEQDMSNQPADMSFVIGQMLATSANVSDPLHGLVDPARIAVAGHSDGADTALAVAYDTCCRDPRVKAAVILAGQQVDIGNGTYYPPGSPPLLAVQGTADSINPPSYSDQIFSAAPAPKFLLNLIGANHLGPFSNDTTYEPIVAKVTTDFLDAYLGGDPSALSRMQADAGPANLATLQGP